jgi:hypothetical protein
MPDASVLARAEKPPLGRPPSCPFYGRRVRAVSGVHPELIPGQPSQCALITSGLAICRMEITGDVPSWECCPRNPANNGSEGQAADTPESVAEKAKAARTWGERVEALGRTEKR